MYPVTRQSTSRYKSTLFVDVDPSTRVRIRSNEKGSLILTPMAPGKMQSVVTLVYRDSNVFIVQNKSHRTTYLRGADDYCYPVAKHKINQGL